MPGLTSVACKPREIRAVDQRDPHRPRALQQRRSIDAPTDDQRIVNAVLQFLDIGCPFSREKNAEPERTQCNR